MPLDSTPPFGSRANTWPRLGLVLLLLLLTVSWGMTWPLMKIALDALPPFTFRTVTVPVAGVLLLALAKLLGQNLRVPRSLWAPLAASAFLNIAALHILSALGVIHTTIGRAVVITYTMPLWAALFARLFLGERLTGRRILALGLGIAGLAALLGNDVGDVLAHPAGPLYALGAALVWAGGTLVHKRVVWSVPVLALTGWQLVVGSIPIVAGALFESPSLSAVTPSLLVAIAFIVLVSLCVCYYLWFKIVSLLPAVVAALSTLLIPVVGVVSGATILGEPLGPSEISALILVCAAIALVMTQPSRMGAAP